ncbi:hypothetical protein [Paraferrimonas sp. SM1919]|uniref:hypothetical protein n=1 Tax=Paraferrimonas sp. SM1919 TaxID=2662263 RepID=UPI0013D3892B|nr:hypothetical protein [Paraferrimonas sp. SM1919]
MAIRCNKCKTLLYRYHKGGKGALVKCFVERISEDHTEQEGVCPSCETQFARRTLVRGTPAFKIIGNKAVMGK